MLISILVCAHNEERKIASCLTALTAAREEGVEILLGLDGCTDRTAAIARQFPDVLIFEYPERRGKSACLTRVTAEAHGELIIVCDVDWDVRAARGWAEHFRALFADERIGGVVIPTANLPAIDRDYLQAMSWAFRGEAWGTRRLWEYQVLTETVRDNGTVLVDPARYVFPFVVNICRRNLIGPYVSTGDDFERGLQIHAAGKRLVIDTSARFLFWATDIDKTIADMFRQRTRGSTVYRSLRETYGFAVPLAGYMLRETGYALTHAAGMSLKDRAALLLWYAVAAAGWITQKEVCRRHPLTTEELWKLRAKR